MAVLIAVLLLSCERDLWITEESIGDGKPVDILLSYELPDADVQVSTRALNGTEAHDVEDLYILIFDGDGNRIDGAKYYFDQATLAAAKTNYDHYSDKGDWTSVTTNPDNANSTHGTVMVTAINSDCYIYGIANVSCSEVGGDALLAQLNDVSSTAPVKDIDDLYGLTTSLSTTADLLDRGNTKLLMSGVFILSSDYDKYDQNYKQNIAGKVNIASIPEVDGRKDLRTAGVIKLRRLSSHISFVLKVNYDVFSEFTPSSWQVVHVPKTSKLMDIGDDAMMAADRIMADAHFTNSSLQTTMLRTEGDYHFDFYMFENHKKEKKIDDTSWYYSKYGPSINDVTYKDANNIDQACENLSLYENIPSYYDTELGNTQEEMFKYAKRELESKYTSGDNVGQIDWNKPNGLTDDIQNSKKFIYSEDNATYVLIKGRLKFKSGTKLKDVTKSATHPDNVNISSSDNFVYADVTFMVHLGYARQNDLKGLPASFAPYENEAAYRAAYKLSDFNSLRNTEYTYEVMINGVNSIYTNVQAKSSDVDGVEGSKLLPGASGFLGVAEKNIFHVDAHYNAFVISLGTKNIEKLKFEIKTPWSANAIKSSDITSVTDYNNRYKNDPDFNWVHFRFNGIQSATNPVYYPMAMDGTVKPAANCTSEDLTLVKPYKLSSLGGDYKDVYNGTYGLMDLYQFYNFIQDQYINWDVNSNAYFSVYVDEYYYTESPKGQSWGATDGDGNLLEPMWHHFVNQPDRYLSFSTSSADPSNDGESSVLTSELMIVQKSIQTYYSTRSDKALGIERVNETPNPRWYVDNDEDKISRNGLKKDDGYGNAKLWIPLKSWNTYVQQKADPTYHNLMMVSTNHTPNNSSAPDGEGDGSTDNPYKASAILLCMNRNRDEDGNGKIEGSELKWYLPSSGQIGYMALFHYALFDPLFPYNVFYEDPSLRMSDGYGNEYVVMPEIRPNTPGQVAGYSESNGSKMGNYVYITSDYMKIQTQEMVNIKDYSFTPSVARTGQMRCVRNLGNAVDAVPDNIYDKETVAASRTFVLDNLDARTLRSSKIENKELEPHTLYSELDRPYHKFQVAKEYVTVNKSDSQWNGTITIRKALNPGPCRTYKDPDEPATAKGSWRVPNQAELALMILYDNSLSSGETRLLPTNASGQFFSNTCWDFTPSKTVWGRVISTKIAGGVWATTLTSPQFKDGKWYDSTITNNILVRCVKDVD